MFLQSTGYIKNVTAVRISIFLGACFLQLVHVTPGGGCCLARFCGGQALEPDLVADGGVLVVVAVPRPDGARLVDDPQPAVPETRLPENRQVRRPVVLEEPFSLSAESSIRTIRSRCINRRDARGMDAGVRT